MDNDRVQLIARLNKLSEPPTIRGVRINALKTWGVLAKAFNNEEWDEAVALTMSMRGEYWAYMGLAKGRSATDQERNEALQNSATTVGDFLTDFFPTLADPEVRREADATLQAEGRPSDFFETVQAKLDGASLVSKSRAIAAKEARRLSTDLSYATALGTYGYWGGFLADFNRYFPECTPPLSNDEIDLGADSLAEYEETIAQGYRELYAAYVAGSQSALFSQAVDTLLRLDAQRDHLARLSAFLSNTLEKSLAQGDVSPRRLGTSALQAGKIARSWAVLATLSMDSVRLALLPPDTEEVTKRFAEAWALPFASGIEDGRNITVKKLLGSSAENNGKYLEVEGVVQDTKTTKTRDGKFLSHLSLVSPAGTERIPAIAIFEDLKHVGITDGCYVNINGDWKTSSSLSAEPFLQIRRLGFEKLGKISWQDRMTQIMSRWFELHPNGHFIQWSIGPEDKGDGDQKSPRTGGGEIIFKEKFGLARR